MADNVVMNPGSGGDTTAADDIAGVKYQRVKLIYGADGVNSGDVASANPLPAVDAAGNTLLTSIDGKITAVNTGAVVVSSSALPAGAATAAKQPALGTAGTPSADVITVQGKAAMTPILTDGSATTQPVSGTFWQATQPVSAAALPLPTGAATSALQTQPGVDIGDVTINNAAGAAAVNIQDGGNSITVDAPVGTPAFVRLSDGAAAISTLPVNNTQINGVAISATNPMPSTNSDGTNTANILKSDGTAAGQNSLLTAGTLLNLTGLTAGSLNADLIASTDVSNYKGGNVTIAGTFTGTITFQGSNDNTTFFSVAIIGSDNSSTTAGTFTAAGAAQTTKTFPIYFRYLRVRMTAYTSGTASGSAVLTTQPFAITLPVMQQSGTWTVQPGNTANTTAWKVDSASIASTTSGYTPNKLISAATTNATSIKGSAGTLGFVSATNINAAARYLKFYNKATAPTVGTDVPLLVYLIPGNTAGAGTNIVLPSEGANFTTGIAFAITTGAADSDTGAVAANEIIINYGTI